MRPILPREMLWTEKKTMDEFFELDPLNESFYEVFITLKEEPFDIQSNEVKVYNEVYFQITRMMYEHPMPSDLSKYIANIKGNLGWNYSAELVISIIYFLIALIDKNERPLNRFFTKSINEKYSSCIYWKPFKHCFEKIKKEGKSVTYQFKPHPIPVSELAKMYVHWRVITNNYDVSALIEIFSLWDNYQDKNILLKLIETSIKFSSPKKQNETIKHIRAVLNDYAIREKTENINKSDLEIRINELDEQLSLLNSEKSALQKHIEDIEGENKRLKALLDKKKRNGVSRRFTLVQIVDYCKGCVTWDDAKSIVAMLNKLLRRIATDEDSNLVDSIETEFINRKFGDTIMGDKNVFRDSSGLNRISLPEGMTHQEAIKLLQNKIKEDGEEG